jgi:hypothetical protein
MLFAHLAGGGNCGRIRAILVHAISERARKFYEDCGFIASPMDPMTLMITVAEAGKAFIKNRIRSVETGLPRLSSRSNIRIRAILNTAAKEK